MEKKLEGKLKHKTKPVFEYNNSIKILFINIF